MGVFVCVAADSPLFFTGCLAVIPAKCLNRSRNM